MNRKFLKFIAPFLCAQMAFAAPPSIPSFQTPKINVDTLDSKAGGGQPVFSNGFDLNEISSPSSPAASKLRIYGKSDDNLYFKNNSGTESQVGSGSGQKNYVQTGSNTAAGWAASGAGITVTTDTTAADLPRANTTKTGIKFTGVSGSTAFGYYDFTLDPNDYSTKLALNFAMACGLAGGVSSTCASSDFQVSVNSCTVAWSSGTCSGTSTRLVLSTDSSSISALPANTGQYRSAFDAPGSAAAFIQVQVGLNATQSHSLVLSDFVVGPGIQTQGAAISEWNAYTPTTAGVGTPSVNNAWWKRDGDSIEVEGYLVAGTTTATALKIGLPNSYTIDSSKIPGLKKTLLGMANTTSGASPGAVYASGFGEGVVYDSADAGSVFFVTQTGVDGGFTYAASVNASTILNSTGQLTYHFFAPISQWAGAGTVNVVQNDCEYVSNTSSTNNDDSTSFAYGPSGSVGILGVTDLSGDHTKRVQFLTPIAQTDRLYLEFESTASGGEWEDVSYAGPLGVGPLGSQGATNYGAGFSRVTGSSSQLEVYFAHYASPGTGYAGAGNGWSGLTNSKWRVKKCAGGQAVGFSTVSANAAGLVPASNTSLDDGSATRLGLKAYSSGTNYNGGNSPTVTLFSGGGTLSSVEYSAFIPYQMQDGGWRLKLNVSVTVSSTTRTAADLAINGITFNTSANTHSCAGMTNDTVAISNTYAAGNDNKLVANHVSATTSAYRFACDVPLASKPTWAY